MQSKINIRIAVDSAEALAKKSLANHLYVMDNSIFNSRGQGTAQLATSCLPGQVIHWIATAIDLQTPVSIRNISFLGACTSEAEVAANIDPAGEATGREAKGNAGNSSTTTLSELDLYTWTGIVPCYMVPGIHYHYRLELQIGNGRYSVMYIDTLSLIWRQ